MNGWWILIKKNVGLAEFDLAAAFEEVEPACEIPQKDIKAMPDQLLRD